MILVITALFYFSGSLEFIDRNVMDSGFRLIQRAPSRSLVIVEIDPRSLRELAAWPWPRTYHAAVLDNLFAAGARTVGVDIDFSSRSSKPADQALAAAFERHAGQVILPAFVQREANAAGTLDNRLTVPNALFRNKVQLGAVNVYPASDSLVRQFPYAQAFGTAVIPSMASRLAKVFDAEAKPFYLDYGIRVRDLPHLSYVDVLRGNFDHSAVAGKNVLIGATAIELGDQFAVPVYRVLPGPLLQALAYETLVQHRALRRTGPLPGFAIAAVLLFVASEIGAAWNWRRQLLALVAVLTLLYGLTITVAALAPVSLDIAVPGFAALAYCIYGWIRQIEQQARLLLQQRNADARRRALMQSVLDDSFDGIVVTDAEGIVEMANPAAGRVLKIPPASMLGKSVAAFLPVSLPAPVQLVAEAGAEEDFRIVPTAPTEVELARPGGDALILEVVLSRSRVSLGSGRRRESRALLTYTFRDISERHRSEQTLRRATQEALAASRAKTEFLANMSHELRTPLNAIIGFSEIIERELFGALPDPRYREYAGDILSSGNHLLEVINNILDMAKFESGEFRAQEDIVDLVDTVEACLRMVRGTGAADKLRIAADLPATLPQLRGDPRLVRQIILNVLGNAVKFTPPGGTVRVTAATDKLGLAVRIADTGIGIPSEELPRIVKPFQQVDSKLARKYEGTGLGLALVNAYLKLHQGDLVIDSAVGTGTTVSLLFPAIRIVAKAA